MASLSLKNIYKVYPSGVTAVSDFNLEIQDKEFIVFVGPSGCGKSTTLRMIAGLEEISDGELYIDGELKNNVAPKDRDIAMVFQNYALYPHMTVYDNMAFGLKLRKVPKAEIDERVKEAARILGIEMYLSRKPKALSGGQRQRVALGRAIVREPKVFLLDEPLSNLDAKLRAQMRTEITKIHNRLATTFIYVTHDQVEAMTMGTRIVVMKDGFMQQVDTPQALYDYPINQFVAGFIGTPQMNFFNAKLTGTKTKVYVEFGEEKILLPKEKVELIYNLEDYLNTDKEVTFGVRPEDLHIESDLVEKYPDWCMEVNVDVVEMLGSETLLYCKLNKEEEKKKEEENPDQIKSIVDDVYNLVAKVDARAAVKRGDVIKMLVDVQHCHLFDKETEMTIVARDKESKKAYLENKAEEAAKAEAAAEAGEAAPAAEAAAPAETETKETKNVFKNLFKKKEKAEKPETKEEEKTEE